MARIRSLHPSQATDEQFVSCGPWARLLALHIRCEADDHGVFEWKPKTIKMRVFPADDVNVEDLLSELVENNQLRDFELDGKHYGVVRNFCRFQRPKKPTYQYPFPNQFRTYVGLSADGSEPVPHQFPTGGEIAPQMEDVIVEEEEEKKEPPQPPQGGSFDEFWNVYPHRGKLPDPKKPAREKFERKVRDGTDPQEIIAGAKRYAELVSAEGIEERLVCQAVTWLNQERWNDAPPVKVETDEERAARERKAAEAKRIQDAVKAGQERDRMERLERYGGDAPKVVEDLAALPGDDLAAGLPDFLRRA